MYSAAAKANAVHSGLAVGGGASGQGAHGAFGSNLAGAPFSPDLFPLCHRIYKELFSMKFDRHFVLKMRDSLQEYQKLLRVVLDFEKTIAVQRNPPDDEDTVEGYRTSMSLDTLEERRKLYTFQRDAAKKAFDGYMAEITAVATTPAVQADLKFLPQCVVGALNAQLYPEMGDDGPHVSFMVQYFKRTHQIAVLVTPLLACVEREGLRGELLVNVDSPTDAAIWAQWAHNTSGFVIPVISNNVHEIRGYSRLARLATGKVLTALQVSMHSSKCRGSLACRLHYTCVFATRHATAYAAEMRNIWCMQ